MRNRMRRRCLVIPRKADFRARPVRTFWTGTTGTLRALKGQIVWPAIESYLSQVLDCDPFMTPMSISSWADISGAGIKELAGPAFHPQGIHADFRGLLCTCARMPEPEGCLEFINPNLNAVSIGNQPSGRLHRPETGQLIYFRLTTCTLCTRLRVTSPDTSSHSTCGLINPSSLRQERDYRLKPPIKSLYSTVKPLAVAKALYCSDTAPRMWRGDDLWSAGTDHRQSFE